MPPNLLDDWKIEDVSVPTRSRLYSRPLHGQGTPMVESLISYIVNLSNAHSVTPRVLIEREIIPHCNIQYDHSASAGFYSYYTRTVNFHSKYAEEMSRVLGELTSQSRLREGTFLPWQDVLDPRGGGLLRRRPHWCPDCLNNMRIENVEPYFPLLWYVDLIKTCSLHNRWLESTCPDCGRQQPFIPPHYHIDHCAMCGAWLGRSSATQKALGAPQLGPMEQFSEAAIAGMVSMNNQASNFAKFRLLQERIRHYVAIAGSYVALGKKVGLQGTVIAQWISKNRRPQIPRIIQVCYFLGKSPVQLFVDQAPTMLPELNDREAIYTPRDRATLTQGALLAIGAELKSILDRADMPPTIPEISSQLGKSIGFLKYRFHGLCQEITRKRSEYFKNRREIKAKEDEEAGYQVVMNLLEMNQRASRRLIETVIRRCGHDIRNKNIREGIARAKTEFFGSSYLGTRDK